MNEALNLFRDIGFLDIVDILIVTFSIYSILKIFRYTRALRILYGLVFIFLLYFIAISFNLITIRWIILNILPVALLIIVIIFQPELRRTLEQLGKGRILDVFSKNKEHLSLTVSEIRKAVSAMSRKRHGCIIVFERATGLSEYIDSGTRLDALVSSELLQTIFFPKTYLHDGAVIIRDNRIAAAGCILPLTERKDLDRSFGTRHRAALGISEITDALVVVVSEESGKISLVYNGSIREDLEMSKFQKYIERLQVRVK